MQADVANRKQSLSLPSENVNVQQNFFCNANKQNAVQCEAAKKDGKEKKEKSEQEKQNAKDGIRTRASEEIGALNRRLRPTRPPPLVLISELLGSSFRAPHQPAPAALRWPASSLDEGALSPAATGLRTSKPV